jgi:hypothetical protein
LLSIELSATPPGKPASVAMASVGGAPFAYKAATSASVHSWGTRRTLHLARGERGGSQHEGGARDVSHDARE